MDKISFTGSVAAGRQIGAVAADRMARVTLELGGKSAAILLNDADLSTALPALAPFTMPFAGQICFAQTRILAPNARFGEVVDAYVRIIGNLRIGDPWDRQTQVGPVLNARQGERILSYIAHGVEQGGRIVIGGGRSARFDRGFFIDPTVFVNVTSDMAIAREEIFGPVVTIQGYDDEDEAIRITNDTDLGLSGSVYSRDLEHACAIACRLRTGQVGINGVELAPSVPFGGRKFSGVGREGGPEGLEDVPGNQVHLYARSSLKSGDAGLSPFRQIRPAPTGSLKQRRAACVAPGSSRGVRAASAALLPRRLLPRAIT